jgi:hypothetical protein
MISLIFLKKVALAGERTQDLLMFLFIFILKVDLGSGDRTQDLLMFLFIFILKVALGLESEPRIF